MWAQKQFKAIAIERSQSADNRVSVGCKKMKVEVILTENSKSHR